ncbi:hypothetical protein H4219_000839 [Mycoemilia scoparia]|uniref:Small ribosomal subunit protein mS29 n=1 Tax=Mycoemilia scoparia TaxID=417184 RepID=A0A9W8DR59_9FUNG|nr:hypothetical protein H4219_000839 [Mycoemilia scoparia]
MRSQNRLLGPVESVSGLKVNEEYYLDAPVVEIDDLIPETATQDNLNKVLSLPGQFVQSLGHDNLPGNFKTVFKLLNKNALVYRPVADSIIQRIKSKNASQKPVIIDGTIGIGKSATLLTSVSLASSLGYLVIYAPNTNVWVDSSQAYFPNPKTNLFSQWSVASAFLKTIRSINKDVLEKIKIESEFVSGGIKLEAGSTLLSVIDLGISAPSQSHDCLELILDTASKQAEVPVLIAIDQVNTLFCQTLYTDQDNTPLQANRLRLVKSLIPFIDGSKKLSNGLSISATSKTETKVQSSDLAKIIKDNLEESKDIKVLDMPKLTFGETKSLLEYFNKSNLIYKGKYNYHSHQIRIITGNSISVEHIAYICI